MATLQVRIQELATRIGTECKTIHGQIGTLTNLTTTQKTSLVVALNEVNSALSALTTTVGSNTTNVSAITERVTATETAIQNLQTAVDGALKINDTTASATTVYSSSKVESVVSASAQQVKDDLLNGAGTAYDTLKELGDLIKTNQDAIASLEAIAAGHVRFDQAQTLTEEQKTQARGNIGAASATEVSANADAIAALEEVVDGLSGGTATDLTDLKNRMTAVEGVAASNTTLAQKGVDDAAAAQADVDALETALGTIDTDFVSSFETALA